MTPAGSDANPGTLAAPLATPGKALALAAAGDTILLRAGTYTITRTLSITKALYEAIDSTARNNIVVDSAGRPRLDRRR